MSYEVPQIRGEEELEVAAVGRTAVADVGGLRSERRGLNHVHAGSLHAPTPRVGPPERPRRLHPADEGVSVWVVPSSAITAIRPRRRRRLVRAVDEQPYRHATYYEIPDEVGHM